MPTTSQIASRCVTRTDVRTSRCWHGAYPFIIKPTPSTRGKVRQITSPSTSSIPSSTARPTSRPSTGPSLTMREKAMRSDAQGRLRRRPGTAWSYEQASSCAGRRHHGRQTFYGFQRRRARLRAGDACWSTCAPAKPVGLTACLRGRCVVEADGWIVTTRSQKQFVRIRASTMRSNHEPAKMPGDRATTAGARPLELDLSTPTTSGLTRPGRTRSWSLRSPAAYSLHRRPARR
jgi:hypothetical protein